MRGLVKTSPIVAITLFSLIEIAFVSHLHSAHMLFRHNAHPVHCTSQAKSCSPCALKMLHCEVVPKLPSALPRRSHRTIIATTAMMFTVATTSRRDTTTISICHCNHHCQWHDDHHYKHNRKHNALALEHQLGVAKWLVEHIQTFGCQYCTIIMSLTAIQPQLLSIFH